ncbi:MAG: hypothetical protein ACE5IK_12815 [Acidobacteriota bacterium]
MSLSRGRKWLLGCTVGLGLALAMVVLVVVGFVRWLQTPGLALEPNRLVDADTRLYIEWTLARDRPGSRNLVRTLLRMRQTVQQQDADLPPFLAWVQSINAAPVSDEQIDQMLPIAAILTNQAGSPLIADAAAFTVNIPSAAHSFRLLDHVLAFGAQRDDDMEYLRYHGEEYYRISPNDGEIWISIVGDDVVLTRDERALRSVIDRLSRPPEALASVSRPLDALLSRAPADSIMRLAVLDQTDSLMDLTTSGLPELAAVLAPLIGRSREVSAWLRAEGDDVLVGQIEASTDPSSDAFPAGLLRTGDTIRLDVASEHIHLTIEPQEGSVRGTRLWAIRAKGVVAWLVHALTDLTPPSS